MQIPHWLFHRYLQLAARRCVLDLLCDTTVSPLSARRRSDLSDQVRDIMVSLSWVVKVGVGGS